ncbi:MAG: AAA family ATPase [Desulfobacterium sp.]|jgi:predicted ATPase|nr:AAA family ATPase [Desulfobacterium sp.]
MKLTKIALEGFKSIDAHDGQEISFGDMTVLLGANGSGKSNLISFFSLLNHVTTGALQNHVGKHGVSQLLHYGLKVTKSISFVLHFALGDAQNTYEVKLSHGLPDRLFISGEKVTFHKTGRDQPQEYHLDHGGAETGLSKDVRTTSKVVHALLSGVRTYQLQGGVRAGPVKQFKNHKRKRI